jgi:hypothetical protein
MAGQQSKFHCRHCRAELGLTDGLRLVIALVEIYSRVPLTCQKCHKVTVWHPPPGRALEERPAFSLAS